MREMRTYPPDNSRSCGKHGIPAANDVVVPVNRRAEQREESARIVISRRIIGVS